MFEKTVHCISNKLERPPEECTSLWRCVYMLRYIAFVKYVEFGQEKNIFQWDFRIVLESQLVPYDFRKKRKKKVSAVSMKANTWIQWFEKLIWWRKLLLKCIFRFCVYMQSKLLVKSHLFFNPVVQNDFSDINKTMWKIKLLKLRIYDLEYVILSSNLNFVNHVECAFFAGINSQWY